MIIEYKERRFLDRFSCIDTIKTLHCKSYFEDGGLIYARINEFNYKTIDKDMIISIR